MIKIEITDPHLVDKHAMYKTAKYLMGMVGLPMTTGHGVTGGLSRFYRRSYPHANRSNHTG